jgi:hypothetical protein
MVKKPQMTTKVRRKAILELINRGISSPVEIVRLLDSEYGIKTTRQTVYRDMQDGIETVTENIIEEHKVSMLDNMNSLLEVLYGKAMRGDTAAAGKYAQMQETKIKILKEIVVIQKELNRKERPIYEIRIGDFPVVKDKKDKEIKKDD